MKQLLELFKTNLQEFASKHTQDIKRDPIFRMHFQNMCSQVGVDPLASHKGFWSELLGVGNFYYELAVQVAQICLATREKNGGLLDLVELERQLVVMRGRHAQIVSQSYF